MKLFLINLLSIILAVNPVLAQVIEGTQAQNVLAPTNYVKNSLAEKAEASADIDDASNILTVSASSPIEGKKSFGIDATVLGQIVRIKSNAIQQVLVGQNCEANFSYFGDASLYKAYIEQGGTKLGYTEQTLKDSGSITQVYQTNFPCGASLAANNIVIESTGNGAAIKVDKLYSGEATNITNQVVVTDWQDFPSVAAGTLITSTGTTPSYGTVVTNKAQWRRVGGNMEIKWDFRSSSAGTSFTGTTLFNLPPGFQIDTNKAKANNTFGAWPTGVDSIVGEFGGTYQGTPNGNGVGKMFVYDSTRLGSFYQYTSTSGASSADYWKYGAFSFETPMSITVTASVPILGWSATQSAITQQCIQDGSCENTFSAYVTEAGVVSGENIDWIQGNAVRNANLWEITPKTNFFGATPNCTTDNAESHGGSGLVSSYYKVGSTASLLKVSTANAGTPAAYKFSIICQRADTDYKPRFAATVLTGSVTSNSSSALRIESFTVNNTNGSNSVLSQSSPGTFTTIGSCDGTGECRYNINPAFSSTNYFCQGTTGYSTGATSATVDVVTAGQLKLLTYLGTNPANSSKTTVTCIGPR